MEWYGLAGLGSDFLVLGLSYGRMIGCGAGTLDCVLETHIAPARRASLWCRVVCRSFESSPVKRGQEPGARGQGTGVSRQVDNEPCGMGSLPSLRE